MKQIEDRIYAAWVIIETKAVVTIKDIEKIKKEFGVVFMKVKIQRERLERSRDMWKKKYKELKNGK